MWGDEKQIMSICCSLSTRATCDNVVSKKIIISDKNHQNICWKYLYIWDARRQTSGSEMKLTLTCIYQRYCSFKVQFIWEQE